MRVDVVDREARELLYSLRRAVRSPTKLHKDVGNAFKNLVQGHFADGEDPWGRAWAELSDVTIKRRRKQSSEPLRDFGFLRASVEAHADATGVEIRIGRADRPVKPHQFGNPTNRMFGRALAPIPARPMLPIREGGRVDLAGTDYLDTLRDLGEAYIARAAKGAA